MAPRKLRAIAEGHSSNIFLPPFSMFSRILIPVDLDHPERSKGAIAAARHIADCFGGSLTVCTVVTDLEAELSGQWLPISYRELLTKARAKAELVPHLEKTRFEVEVGTGAVCHGIIEVAERVAADLIVMASHKPRASDYLLSSNAARVARRASCSVLVVRGRGQARKQMGGQSERKRGRQPSARVHA